jgi:hypothetical protein
VVEDVDDLAVSDLVLRVEPNVHGNSAGLAPSEEMDQRDDVVAVLDHLLDLESVCVLSLEPSVAISHGSLDTVIARVVFLDREPLDFRMEGLPKASGSLSIVSSHLRTTSLRTSTFSRDIARPVSLSAPLGRLARSLQRPTGIYELAGAHDQAVLDLVQLSHLKLARDPARRPAPTSGRSNDDLAVPRVD